jgi:hypothetical protein
MSDPRRPASLRPDALSLRGERGISLMPQLIVAVLVTMVTATALVRNIWEAHDSELRTYRRMRVLQELQAEMEYWKAQVFINGINAPTPNARYSVPIDTGKRSRQRWILGVYDPAPVVRYIPGQAMATYEITVSISWPEGGRMQRESLRTAINQVR